MVKLGAIIEKLGSPQLAKMWAILATISAAISYAAFLTSGGGFGSTTADLAISTLLLFILIGIHTQLILYSPGIRNHPQIRVLDPHPYIGCFLVGQCLPYLLTKYHLTLTNFGGSGGGDLLSVVAGAAYVVDLVFVWLCVRPGWGFNVILHLLYIPMANLVAALVALFRENEASLWLRFGFALFITFHHSITVVSLFRDWRSFFKMILGRVD